MAMASGSSPVGTGDRRSGGVSLILGTASMAAFYGVTSQPVFEGSLVHRYTMGHPVEVVCVFLFLVALADLLVKAVRLRGERDSLGLPVPDGRTDPDSLLEAHETGIFARRLRDASNYLRQKGSGQGLEEHVRYLAELEGERSHAGYSLVRLVAWMIPILGFLGTVIGITLAIANVTPDQLEGSIEDVTGGLAVAFDTTALALSLSIVLMLANFLVERAEQRLLLDVEVEIGRRLAKWYGSGDAETSAYLDSLRATSDALLAHARSLVDTQVRLWSTAMSASDERRQEWERRQEERFRTLLGALESERRVHAEVSQATAERVEALQQGLERVVGSVETLVAGEERIAQLQQGLARNLTLLRETGSFEEAVHSLTGAIHLMTARRRQSELGDERVA